MMLSYYATRTISPICSFSTLRAILSAVATGEKLNSEKYLSILNKIITLSLV